MKVVIFLCALVAGPVWSQDEPWAVLRQGGHVVLLRHATTTAGVGDPPEMRLEDCSTQRNLSEEGRAQARRIGEGFREFRVPVELVLTSEWCRCIETAALAFGSKMDTWPALNNLFGRPENRQKQVDALAERIGGWRGKGNLVLVTHGSTILALTRVGTQMGEMLILAPQGGDRFALVSRLHVSGRTRHLDLVMESR